MTHGPRTPQTLEDFISTAYLNRSRLRALLNELVSERHVVESEPGVYSKSKAGFPECINQGWYVEAVRMVRGNPQVHPSFLALRAKAYCVSLALAKSTMRKLVRGGIAIEVNGVWKRRS